MEEKALINAAVSKLAGMENLKAIILFGSYAKGTATKDSDIDLLMVFDQENPELALQEVIRRLSEIDKEGKISPRVTNLSDYEPEFFLDVFRHGKILYGKVVLNQDKAILRPYRAVYYKLSGLTAAKKVLVSKQVHGSASVVGNKRYTYKGIKDIPGFEVLGRSAILVPEKSCRYFKGFLEENGVKYKEKKVWLE
ncbi:nucleotidyltransferase domain-containing protein [Candidatus Woesearchaeota archaeon]|nr:nucleotidyltransferase domain-containing protein [Candidatus Woesearchaeota archaeon]